MLQYRVTRATNMTLARVWFLLLQSSLLHVPRKERETTVYAERVLIQPISTVDPGGDETRAVSV